MTSLHVSRAARIASAGPVPARPARRGGTLAAVPGEPIIVSSDGSTVGGGSVRAGDCALRIPPRDLTFFIRIDHQVRLRFDDVEVVIEGAFVLEADGVVDHLHPAERAQLGPLLALYPARLDSAAVDNDGTLRLGFDSGAQVTVPPDTDYEPWQIVGPGTSLVVCLPGESGELAIWD